MLQVWDGDSGENGEFDCDVIDGDAEPGNHFRLTEFGPKSYRKSYKLVTEEMYTEDSTSFPHIVLIECTDHGKPALTSSQIITVYIV